MSDTRIKDEMSLIMAMVELTTELHRLRDEHAKLLRFARLNLSEWPETESFEIQEAAKLAGLVVEVKAAKPCSDDCGCASFYGQDEFPLTCYRLADFVRAP